MNSEPFVPLFRRLAGEGPLENGPYEGVPPHLQVPLREWLSDALYGHQGQGLARRVMLRLGLRVAAPYADSADYSAALLRIAQRDAEIWLTVVDAVLQLHPNRPGEPAPGAFAAAPVEWTLPVGRLAELLDDAASAYEVSRVQHRLVLQP